MDDAAIAGAREIDWNTRDYFAEMYVAGILADNGWDIYFPRRDKGFDMIVSRQGARGTIIRPVQVRGKYAADSKTDESSYGYVGKITPFHDDMILALPYFTSRDDLAPRMIAWMARHELKLHSKGVRCEPAKFAGGEPMARPGYDHCFGRAGLMRFEAEVAPSIL
jgi:hypothetical protein